MGGYFWPLSQRSNGINEMTNPTLPNVRVIDSIQWDDPFSLSLSLSSFSFFSPFLSFFFLFSFFFFGFYLFSLGFRQNEFIRAGGVTTSLILPGFFPLLFYFLFFLFSILSSFHKNFVSFFLIFNNRIRKCNGRRSFCF